MTCPDSWVMLKIQRGDDFVYKVFAEWRGSYLSGDSWRMNSGVANATDNGDYYDFEGYSGSVYSCRKTSYGIRGMYAIGILNDLIEQITEAGGSVRILNEDTDFLEIDWSGDVS